RHAGPRSPPGRDHRSGARSAGSLGGEGRCRRAHRRGLGAGGRTSQPTRAAPTPHPAAGGPRASGAGAGSPPGELRRPAAALGAISGGTGKAAGARAAPAAGAAVVNDVSGLAFDAALAGVVGAAGAGMIVMHMRGTPDTMDSLAVYRHVAGDVAAELGAAAARAEAGGVARERIVVDPGFGFAKTPEQNFRLLDELATVVGLGYPVAVGPSRKRFR